MCMRTGFGVGERSRRLRRPCEPECERGRSLGRSGLLRLPLSSTGSLSELRRGLSLDFGRSLDSLRAVTFAAALFDLDLDALLRFARRSVPLLELDDDEELEDDELDELDRDPELLRDELLSLELPLLSLLLETEPLFLRSRSRSRPRLVAFFSFSFSATGDADRSRAILMSFAFSLESRMINLLTMGKFL